MHILSFPMHEIGRRDIGERWCFHCRKRHPFERVTNTPTLDPDLPLDDQTGAFYGPSSHNECTKCREIDSDQFPGT